MHGARDALRADLTAASPAVHALLVPFLRCAALEPQAHTVTDRTLN